MYPDPELEENGSVGGGEKPYVISDVGKFAGETLDFRLDRITNFNPDQKEHLLGIIDTEVASTLDSLRRAKPWQDYNLNYYFIREQLLQELVRSKWKIVLDGVLPFAERMVSANEEIESWPGRNFLTEAAEMDDNFIRQNLRSGRAKRRADHIDVVFDIRAYQRALWEEAIPSPLAARK